MDFRRPIGQKLWPSKSIGKKQKKNNVFPFKKMRVVPREMGKTFERVVYFGVRGISI